MHANVNVQFPEEILLVLRKDKDEFAIEMKRAAAIKYFKERKLSIGQCSELAEMTEEEFIKYLGEQKISIFSFDSDEELMQDIKNA